MGNIRRQSILISSFSYLGVGLGYINVVLLFPKFFSPEEFGLTRVLVATIGVLSQFALFGMGSSIIRFFPFFKKKKSGHNGFLNGAMLLGAIGTATVWLLLFLFKPMVIEYYSDRSPLIANFFILLFPYLAFEVLFQVLRSYSRALLHAVADVIHKEVLLRFITLVLILLFHFGMVNFEQFMWLYVLQFAAIAVGMVVFLMSKRELHIKQLPRDLKPEFRSQMLNYSFFTILSGVGSMVLINIDVLMIQSMVGLDQVAFYAVAFYIVALINIPRNAIGNIAVPIISDAWKRDDLDTVQSIYQKTAINQLLIGVLIFVGIWANQEVVFSLLPPEYAGGKWVLFFIGIARLIDVGFGINGGVITNSPYYRFDTYAGLSLILLTVASNLILIPVYGIVGAAIATGISLLVFNLARYILLKWKYGLDPFSYRTVLVMLLAVMAYWVSTFVPKLNLIWIDVIIRSAVICAVFVPVALALSLSEDANKLLGEIYRKISR